MLRWSVGYGIGLRALCALGWMGVLALIGWLVTLRSTRGQGLSPWTALWFSASYAVPGFGIAKEDEESVKVGPGARSWLYVQRLACYGLALIAGAAAVGIVQT